MKTYLVALSVLSLGTLWLSAANAKPIETHRGPFAVVELFTSEGCSSCPPADRVLQRLHRDHGAEGERVFVLSFHVDYWNRLGWEDPFSRSEFSQRQRAYAQAFNQRSVYTPQMVVNGRSEFVGSREDQARREVERVLRPDQTAEVGVGLAAAAPEDDQRLQVDWRLDRLPGDIVLNVAVVEDGLSIDVPRGENHGQTLRHDGVVRGFQTITPTAKHGSLSIPLPQDLDPAASAVVAFVQDEKTKRIIGAHRISLTTP
ncbi:MAG: DUF1223 domain-containing protein [Planctomycetota bacterium]